MLYEMRLFLFIPLIISYEIITTDILLGKKKSTCKCLNSLLEQTRQVSIKLRLTLYKRF